MRLTRVMLATAFVSGLAASGNAAQPVEAALGAAARPKVAASPAAVTVTPGTGGTSSANLDAAIAALRQPSSDSVDLAAPVSLKGTITRVDLTGPRTLIYLDVKEASPADAPKGTWIVQTGTVNTLKRMGVIDTATIPGSPLVVQGYRSANKDCSAGCMALGREITFAGGEKVFLGAAASATPLAETQNP